MFTEPHPEESPTRGDSKGGQKVGPPAADAHGDDPWEDLRVGASHEMVAPARPSPFIKGG